MNRREAVVAGLAALLAAAVAKSAAQAAARPLFLLGLADQRYAGGGDLIALFRRQRWPILELFGRDTVRLWRDVLRPALESGTTLVGITTHSDWQIVRYSVIEARGDTLMQEQPGWLGPSGARVSGQWLSRVRAGGTEPSDLSGPADDTVLGPAVLPRGSLRAWVLRPGTVRAVVWPGSHAWGIRHPRPWSSDG
jgi:hypothetical protein